MNDQVGMRLRHRAKNVQEHPDAIFHIKSVLVAIAVDVIALDVFENEIGLTRLGNTGINQFCNVLVNEKSKYPAFPFEALFATLPDERDIEEFYRYAALEPSIVSFRQPNAAHAAVTDLRQKSVNANALAGEADGVRQSYGRMFK